MIASDGRLIEGKGHPRSAATYARVLGKYVREEKVLSLMDAIRKSVLMPAQRLESMSPQRRQKGRLKIGADADISVFDFCAGNRQGYLRKPPNTPRVFGT
jgi:dihydroorotase